MRIVIDSLEKRESSFGELFGKIRARLAPLLRRNEISLHWQVDGIEPLDELEPEEALHCIRIIQESVANAIQHAHANNVEIEISINGEGSGVAVIEIRDDGIGPTPGSRPAGRGTRNMMERAKGLGAALSIEPAEPGTRVRLSVPIVQKSDGDTSGPN